MVVMAAQICDVHRTGHLKMIKMFNIKYVLPHTLKKPVE